MTFGEFLTLVAAGFTFITFFSAWWLVKSEPS
jgi:hypothetical protein